MRITISLVGVIVAGAIGTTSVSLSAAPVTTRELKPMTSNARITAMDRRLDRFMNRLDRQSKLYVSREKGGERVAQTSDYQSSRYNR